MKQFIVYSILFCLAFLNVPRSLVHECHHDTAAHVHKHDADSDSDEVTTTIDQDECFICEFDVDVFECPAPFIPKYYRQNNATQTEVPVSKVKQEEFEMFTLRGPPTV